MDTGNGTFKMGEWEDLVKEQKINPNAGGIFQVGEEVEIKGSKFVIARIMRNRMVLKLRPR